MKEQQGKVKNLGGTIIMKAANVGMNQAGQAASSS
jgi:hypothetical protein